MSICTKCCMDNSAKEIKFDKTDGTCNFCYQSQKSLKEIEADKHTLPFILNQLRKEKGKYNCLIGLSGGTDSSTVLHYAVRFRLRPLCFSLENGWEDPKATENIKKLVEKLKIPFEIVKVDKDKYAELQNAYFKAGVPNVEAIIDHILMAVTYKMASKYGIKWILSGGNVATENCMPPSWSFSSRDLVNIKDIYKKITGKRLKGLPVCSLLKWNYYKNWKRIKTLYILDYLDYNRDEAIKFLEKNYSYENCGDKHCENVFTNWFQSFYLYEKFGIDKRKAHFSSLINSGQMTRDEAIERLKESPIYPKLGIEQKVMSYPKHAHEEYKVDKNYERIAKIIKWIKN